MMNIERQSTSLVHSKFIMLREQLLSQAASLASLKHTSLVSL